MEKGRRFASEESPKRNWGFCIIASYENGGLTPPVQP